MQLFTSTACVPCKRVKQYITDHNIDCEIVSVDTAEGREQFLQTGYRSVPLLKRDDYFYHGDTEVMEVLRDIS